jgi:hypothetical protein
MLILSLLSCLLIDPQLPRTSPDDPYGRAKYNQRVRGSEPRKSLWDQAKERIVEENYEGAILCLKIMEKSVTQEQYNEYCFMMAVSHFALNHKQEAQKWVNAYENSWQKPKQVRHDNLIFMMGNDLATWKEDDLGDITRDMGVSGQKLKNAYAGEGTQHVQKEIVNKLDKIIKELENKGKGGGDGQANGKDGQDKQQGPGQNQPKGPANDSTVMGGSGAGKVDEKQMRKIAENWGTMPPAERAKVMQEITRDLPPKYKPMIDEYFKALNRIHK